MAMPTWTTSLTVLRKASSIRSRDLAQLKVMARSTMFRFKGRESDPQKVGKELGVSAVMTGRMLQQGENLTVSVELVNVADGTQLWGEQYNRRAANLATVQQEIARDISERLRWRLSGEEQQLNKGGGLDVISDNSVNSKFPTAIRGYSSFMVAKLSRPLILSFDCGQSRTKSWANTEPTDRKLFDAISSQNLSTSSTALALIPSLPLIVPAHTSSASPQSLRGPSLSLRCATNRPVFCSNRV